MSFPVNMPVARAYAEAGMTATCTIREKSTGEPVTDLNSGAVTLPEGDIVYTGRCRVRPEGRQAQAGEAGGAELFTFDYLVSVPYFVTGVSEGMSCKIDTSPDPDLAGVTVEVRKVDRGDHITARRLSCNEVAGP